MGPEHGSLIQARGPLGSCTVLLPRGVITISFQKQRLMYEGVLKVFQMGALTEVTPTKANPQFYSSRFLVNKKDGSKRPAEILKRLNEDIAPHHFKIKEIQFQRDLLRRNNWMTEAT